MKRVRASWVWLLFASALAACATVPAPSASESASCEEATEIVSFEQACAEESSLVVLCANGQCELYRCREVMTHLTVGRVIPVRGGALSLPGVQGGVQRYWGSAQEVPQDTRPVLIIPWEHKPPLLPSQQQTLEEVAKERQKPHEKHHVFSQEFREFFAEKGINIDEYTILLELLIVPYWKQPPPLPSGY